MAEGTKPIYTAVESVRMEHYPLFSQKHYGSADGKSYHDSGESSGLLREAEEASRYSSETLYRNFALMSIAFSLNHGAVTSCLAYASTELGDVLGSYSSGILFVCFAITSFFFAKPIVSMIGPKNGLIVGVVGYCIYVIGFVLSIMFIYLSNDLEWITTIISALIGGFAGGLLWTSQGRLFSRHSKLYSDVNRLPVTNVTSNFAGLFALLFLGTEMALKLIATLIFLALPTGAPFIVFLLYTALAVVSCFSITILDDLDDKGTRDFSYSVISSHVGAAAKLVYKDKRMALIVPFQLAFGLTSSFVPYYVFGTVIADSPNLGETYIGLLSAIIVFTGAVTSIPASFLSNVYGKLVVVITGGFCFAAAGVAFFLTSDEELGTWVYILPLVVVYGVGRGIWESTNKAAIADFFVESPDLVTSAYASTAFFAGYGSAMGFFTFASLDRLQMAGTIIFLSIIGNVCYYCSFTANLAEQNRIRDDKQKVVARRIALAERLQSLSTEF